MNKASKIAVIGGTGKAGRYVLDELVRQGYSLKVLARNPDKVIRKSPLIEIIPGSVRNYDTVQRLLTGCEAIISTLGPSKRETDTCSIAVSHVTRLMAKLKIRRYLEVAGLGIETPDDKKGFRTRLIVRIIKLFAGTILSDRQKSYSILETSKTNWTLVRCPMIELTDARRVLKISLQDSPGTKVSAADLADFLVSQINDVQYFRKCPFVAS